MSWLVAVTFWLVVPTRVPDPPRPQDAEVLLFTTLAPTDPVWGLARRLMAEARAAGLRIAADQPEQRLDDAAIVRRLQSHRALALVHYPKDDGISALEVVSWDGERLLRQRFASDTGDEDVEAAQSIFVLRVIERLQAMRPRNTTPPLVAPRPSVAAAPLASRRRFRPEISAGPGVFVAPNLGNAASMSLSIGATREARVTTSLRAEVISALHVVDRTLPPGRVSMWFGTFGASALIGPSWPRRPRLRPRVGATAGTLVLRGHGDRADTGSVGFLGTHLELELEATARLLVRLQGRAAALWPAVEIRPEAGPTLTSVRALFSSNLGVAWRW